MGSEWKTYSDIRLEAVHIEKLREGLVCAVVKSHEREGAFRAWLYYSKYGFPRGCAFLGEYESREKAVESIQDLGAVIDEVAGEECDEREELIYDTRL